MEITKTLVAERNRALLGGDYSTYRAQSTRRVHALRKRLNITTRKGQKFSSRSAVTAEDFAKNPAWAHLLVACSERAWADAMTMKSLRSPENTQRPLPSSTKKQITSRLQRAIRYARNLVAVVQDNRDGLEAKAYLALLSGALAFERSRWAACISSYSFTRIVYVALSTKDSSTFEELLEGTIDPSIRYAAYQEKMPRTKAVADIAIEQYPTEESGAKSEILKIDKQAFQTTTEKTAVQTEGITDLPTSIAWRGRTVKLEDAVISQALGAAQSREATLQDLFKSGSASIKQISAAYDDVIEARQNAADATKNAIDELLSEGVDQGDSRVQSLQVTRTAVNYAVIESRIGRNRVLCGSQDGLLSESISQKTSKSQVNGTTKSHKEEPIGRKLARLRERVALYDSILQNLDAVKQLPGVVADTSFTTELDQKKSYFRALKCLAIGRSHAVQGNILNALALFHRAQELAQSSSGAASSTTQADQAPKLEISQAQLTTVRQHLGSLVLRYRALADIQSRTPSTNTKEQRYSAPLIQRLHLNIYDDNIDLKNIVTYPAKLQPIPMKPLFFDLAWDYIQYPGHEPKVDTTKAPSTAVAAAEPDNSAMEDVQAEKPAAGAPKKKGWFGFGR